MTVTPTPVKKRNKVSIPLFVLLVITLVAAAILLVGWGGSILGEYNKKDYFIASEGTAKNLTEADPHIQTVADQYKKMKTIAIEDKASSIFERIYAGDDSYEKITPEQLGQYSIDTFFFFKDEKDAKNTYSRSLEYYEDLGYSKSTDTSNSDTSVTLIRPVSPKEEQSEVSPGNDTITLIYAPTAAGKPRIIFTYKSTELPLSGIPQDPNFDYYTVTQTQKLNDEILNGTVNSCDYAPNGVVGGWDPALPCGFEDLKG